MRSSSTSKAFSSQVLIEESWKAFHGEYHAIQQQRVGNRILTAVLKLTAPQTYSEVAHWKYTSIGRFVESTIGHNPMNEQARVLWVFAYHLQIVIPVCGHACELCSVFLLNSVKTLCCKELEMIYQSEVSKGCCLITLQNMRRKQELSKLRALDCAFQSCYNHRRNQGLFLLRLCFESRLSPFG